MDKHLSRFDCKRVLHPVLYRHRMSFFCMLANLVAVLPASMHQFSMGTELYFFSLVSTITNVVFGLCLQWDRHTFKEPGMYVAIGAGLAALAWISPLWGVITLAMGFVWVWISLEIQHRRELESVIHEYTTWGVKARTANHNR